MLTLFYFNWVGTPEEFKEFNDRMNSINEGIEGVDLKGLFVPASEWNFVALLEGSYEKILELYRTYVQKYGSPIQMQSAKIELLMTFEEVGYA